MKQQQQKQNNEKKQNGILNVINNISPTSTATRTSTKFYNDVDETKKLLKKEEVSISNHSIASQSVSKIIKKDVKEEETERVVKDENGIKTTFNTSTTTTGIKQEEISDEEEITGKSTRSRKIRKFKKNHQSSRNVIVEPIAELSSLSSRQLELDRVIGRMCINNRDERLRMKKSYLRHLLSRHERLKRERKNLIVKSRKDFLMANKLLKEMNYEREEM